MGMPCAAAFRMSLPVWEEWIEIPFSQRAAARSGRSLPVWEEWIEIGTWRARWKAERSLPVWEEWIEMHINIHGRSTAPVSSRMGRVD